MSHPGRSKYFINKKFQISIMFRFFLLSAITAGLILLAIELFFDKPYQFMPQGKTVFRYRDIPEYKNNVLTGFRRVNKKEKPISTVKLIYDNQNRLSIRVLYNLQNQEIQRSEYSYDWKGKIAGKRVYKKGKFHKHTQYFYEGENIIGEHIYNEQGKKVQQAGYKYMTNQSDGKKRLQSRTVYSFDGNNPQKEIFRWEFYYDIENTRIEEQYKRKDGSLYLFRIRKYADNAFQRLEYIVVYEDRFSDQFKDFLFKPIYNKDGDIIGLQGDPVNRYSLMITPIIFTSVILMLVILVFGIIMSHKMAGPIYRIRSYIYSMKKGEFGKPLQLRKNDEFQDLAQELQELSEIIRKRLNPLSDNGTELADEDSDHSKANGKVKKMVKRVFKKKNKD